MFRSLSLMLVVALLGATGARAVADDAAIQRIVARSGKYTFWIDVKNRSYRSIDQARAWVTTSGDRSARITVQADGYRDGSAWVSLRPNQTSYNVRVTLDDPTVWFDVKDETYKNLPNYSRADTFGVWGDEFKWVSRIDAEGYTKFSAYDVDVRVNGSIPFGEQVRVRDLGSQREIEVTVKRRRMNSFSNRMEIRVRSDASFGDAPAATEEPRPTDAHSRYRNQAFRELHRVPEA